MPISYFRTLYERLLEYEGERPYQDVLLPGLDKAHRSLDTLKACGDIQARHLSHENIVEHLWELYALSRVSDVLLLPFQKGDYDGTSWPGPILTPEERDSYFVALGMRRIKPNHFHPFVHEIVEVVQSPDPAEPILLDAVLWSGFMLGSLLICRAGARVRGGRDHIKKETAETSTMYFTFRRKNRPVDDLSHGWGSNSQWRTSFRRDYVDESYFYYNVDGSLAASRPIEDSRVSASGNLAPAERIELVVNRCFILSEKLHEGLWPYYERFSEDAGSTLRLTDVSE
jgi:hypothetical protein